MFMLKSTHILFCAGFLIGFRLLGGQSLLIGNVLLAIGVLLPFFRHPPSQQIFKQFISFLSLIVSYTLIALLVEFETRYSIFSFGKTFLIAGLLVLICNQTALPESKNYSESSLVSFLWGYISSLAISLSPGIISLLIPGFGGLSITDSFRSRSGTLRYSAASIGPNYIGFMALCALILVILLFSSLTKSSNPIESRKIAFNNIQRIWLLLSGIIFSISAFLSFSRSVFLFVALAVIIYITIFAKKIVVNSFKLRILSPNTLLSLALVALLAPAVLSFFNPSRVLDPTVATKLSFTFTNRIFERRDSGGRFDILGDSYDSRNAVCYLVPCPDSEFNIGAEGWKDFHNSYIFFARIFGIPLACVFFVLFFLFFRSIAAFVFVPFLVVLATNDFIVNHELWITLLSLKFFSDRPRFASPTQSDRQNKSYSR